MQTILDYTQEIVDEIRRYKDEFTLTFTPDTIRIIKYYEDEDWTVIDNFTFIDGSFKAWTDYGFDIKEGQFDTIKEAVDFIFK